MRHVLHLISALLIALPQIQAQCLPDEHEVVVHITPDEYYYETSWSLASLSGEVYASSTLGNDSPVADTFCVPSGCLRFAIADSYGDGICCGFGDGSYTIYYDGVLAATGGEFTNIATAYVGCGPGDYCGTASSIATGEHSLSLPPTANYWYAFTPGSSGQYAIGACAPGCTLGAWVYDNCENLIWTNTVEGSIAFSANACATGLMANLQAGQLYYIRIGGFQTAGCAGTAGTWSLDYVGPVTGCTDPDACNYDPTATLSDGSCIYPGDPACPDGPDLIVAQADLASSLYVDYENNGDACLIEEGCVKGYGQRELLRFTTRIENIGTKDYYLGNPPANPSQANAQWEWDPCHGHWHYEGYAEYVVYDENGLEIPIGFKNGFCVMDLDCSFGGGIPKFNCGNQGISANCGDIYDSYLPCQWIDISSLAEGDYLLVVRVNWNQTPDALGYHESNYDNNWAQVCFSLSRSPVSGAASITVLAECAPYTDCEGTVYGDAQPDCSGICEGFDLHGDLSQDTLRNMADIQLYLDACLSDDLAATVCNDLNNDGLISVTDASLLMDCIIHGQGNTPPGHNHVPCRFPHQVTNPNDTVQLSLWSINEAEQYVEIWMRNPHARLYGIEFGTSGLHITGIDNLVPDFVANIAHDGQEIVALTYNESYIPKNSAFFPFLRLHYDQLDGDEVCLVDITAAVNKLHEEIQTSIGNACLPTSFSSNGYVPATLRLSVLPNPSSGEVLFRPEGQDGTWELAIYDLTGRPVWQGNLPSAGLSLPPSTFPSPGHYIYQVRDTKGSLAFGRLLRL